ncbi:MAG: fimbrillin family protein [Candidatus Symbiothrix sp.]|nr:fimbrillin family protein [Candidatus Symbiothrix sp.]
MAIAIIGIGCSEDQVVETLSAPQAITFRTQGGMPELRATGTTTAYVDAFVVYGTDNQLSNTNELIFNGVTVARQVSDRSFDYNPKKYFTVGATNAGFVAYSPVSQYVEFKAIQTSPVANGISFDYTVVAPDESGNTTQEDLLVAGTAINATSTSDTGTPSTTVSMNFQHALARIFVQAESSLTETVTIDSLKLLNLYSKGTFTITPTTDVEETDIWGTYSAVKDYKYTLAPTGVSVETSNELKLVTSKEQGMMVLPQATVNPSNDQVFDTGDFALELYYDVANIKNQRARILLTDGYKFEAGKQYAINIAFGGVVNVVEINFDITVTDFSDTPALPVVPVPVGE